MSASTEAAIARPARAGTAAGGRAARALRAASLAVAVVLTAGALWRLLASRVALALLLGPAFWAFVAALAVALALELAALARLGRTRAVDAFADLRKALVAATLAWIGMVLWAQPLEAPWVDLGLGIAAGLYALPLALEPLWARLPRRVLRAADVLLFTACASVLGAEVGLRALARWRPSQLLAPEGHGSRWLEDMRSKPGFVHFGFPCNEGGHYDEPFQPASPGERRVATVGDSFSLGVVPHSRHYTTVAERELGVPVDNYGVPGVGVPEYEQLILQEVIQNRPSAIVLALFVGNDLEVPAPPAPQTWWRSTCDRDAVRLWLVPNRLARMARERERLGGGPVAEVAGARAQQGAEIASSFPWLDDPSRERPTFSQEGFLDLETTRASFVCGPTEWLPRLVDELESIRDAVRPTPFAVMLIPDEFQVEDGLWETVRAALGLDEGSRDLAQRQLVAALEERGIDVLDLLPAMLAEPAREDGRRALYHLRDSHWNSRGNEVAGKALARFLAERLPR